MKIEDIERELPNGFHDALLRNVFIDYDRHEAIFEIEIWIGNIDSEIKKLREVYRKGRLRLHDLRYCAIESPDPEYPYAGRRLTIDTGEIGSLKKVPPIRLPEAPSEEAFVHWFFVRQWNAFIYVSATNARFEWIDDLPP